MKTQARSSPAPNECQRESTNSSLIGKWKFPTDKFIYEKVVLLKQTNLMGNTYFDNYITWQGEAREAVLLQHPCIGEFLKNFQHIKMVTHTVHQQFFHESTFGDIVKIVVTTRELKPCSFVAVFRFYNRSTEILLAEGWQRICFVDVRIQKPCAVPQILLDVVEPLLEVSD